MIKDKLKQWVGAVWGHHLSLRFQNLKCSPAPVLSCPYAVGITDVNRVNSSTRSTAISANYAYTPIRRTRSAAADFSSCNLK